MEDICKAHPYTLLVVIVIPLTLFIWKVIDYFHVASFKFAISQQNATIEGLRNDLARAESKLDKLDYNTQEIGRYPSAKLISQSSSPASACEPETLLRDMDLLVQAWRDENLTELQKKKFEEDLIGRKVQWIATFSAVSEGYDSKLWVSLTSRYPETIGVHVIAVFEPESRKDLLRVAKGTEVVVSGYVKSFGTAPIINQCSLLS